MSDEDSEEVVIPDPIDISTPPAFPPPKNIGTDPYVPQDIPVTEATSVPVTVSGEGAVMATAAEKAAGIKPKSTPDAPAGEEPE